MKTPSITLPPYQPPLILILNKQGGASDTGGSGGAKRPSCLPPGPDRAITYGGGIIIIPVAAPDKCICSRSASRRDEVLEPESLSPNKSAAGKLHLSNKPSCFYWRRVVYRRRQNSCHLSHAHLRGSGNAAACFIFPSGVIYLHQFPLRPKTGLMPSFNMLFTHKNELFTAACACRTEGNEWAPAPLSDLLYHSLTIWIANRTIYHGAVICFTCAAPVPEAYGNGLHV